ncbi:hypothetical protein DP116_16835 [Brasilonema bromeliae SPC951]|uniref:Uncharacterized protein n=1 Tax=Brasilonema bromeliae SPC951 TaxID=385972 RepID=A0ABX1P9D7_9CYAN|nr:hypothetical protein [Brasilonema bromeliae SPC951]
MQRILKESQGNWFSKIQGANFEYITSIELGGILCSNHHANKRVTSLLADDAETMVDIKYKIRSAKRPVYFRKND